MNSKLLPIQLKTLKAAIHRPYMYMHHWHMTLKYQHSLTFEVLLMFLSLIIQAVCGIKIRSRMGQHS